MHAMVQRNDPDLQTAVVDFLGRGVPAEGYRYLWVGNTSSMYPPLPTTQQPHTTYYMVVKHNHQEFRRTTHWAALFFPGCAFLTYCARASADAAIAALHGQRRLERVSGYFCMRFTFLTLSSG